MENKEWSADELRNKAERYCVAAEHCPMDVREKMRQWGASDELADTILNRLIQEGYVSEQRYCRAFCADKLHFQGWGRNKIRVMLRAKGLPEDRIAEALNNIDETDYFTQLAKVAKKKPSATKEQLIRFLLQRGFLWDEIRSALSI